MDATRSDFEFTAEVLQIAIDAGRDVINVPDTVGYATPEEYAAMWTRFYELVPDLRKVETSVHCHDDLGLAVANSYAGVIAGARQVECAINGLGERAGNCSLEEIAMLIQRPPGRPRLHHRHQHPRDRPHQPPGQPHDRVRGAAEQGDRRDATPSPTSRGSTRTGCSRSARPTRSWTRPKSASSPTRSCSASTPAATR